MAYPEGPDVSYAQGNYIPTAQDDFVIVNASRANRGFLEVGSNYKAQVDAARKANKPLGHYFFNGNTGPIECADFFVDNLYDFRKGDLIAVDVEDEASTGTVAWNPVQADRFLNRAAMRLEIPRTATAAYMNRDVRGRYDWFGVWVNGTRKWISSPGTDPGDWDIWQHTFTPMDRNYAKLPLNIMAAVPIVTPPTPAPQKDEDMNGFYVRANNTDKFYWFTPSTGKLRSISSAEWQFLRAVEASKNAANTVDVVLPTINVDQSWIDKGLKL